MNRNTYFPLIMLFCTSIIYLNGQVNGCTDQLATNYNLQATQNDGSCVYANTNISTTSAIPMDPLTKETSGLIFWNQKYWTHNDDSDHTIYAIDSTNGQIIDQIAFNGIIITDWEELQHDDLYFYIGDVGNNATGVRQNLAIFKILKSSVQQPPLQIDTIRFHYANQTDFSTPSSNATDFDCEAFIVTEDSIYLFSKEWVRKKSTIYSIPNYSGNFSAQPIYELNVDGLITGACYTPNRENIVLCGYNTILQPFIYLISDIQNIDFQKSNKRKLNISGLLGYQIEAIASANGLQFKLTNELFSLNGTTINNQMMEVNLEPFLPKKNTIGIKETTNPAAKIYPNPAHSVLNIENVTDGTYQIISAQGIFITSFDVKNKSAKITIEGFASGIYFIHNKANTNTYKFLIP